MASPDTAPRTEDRKTSEGPNVLDRAKAAAMASAAVVAAAAVNEAVDSKSLEAPETSKSWIFKDGGRDDRRGKVDEAGLPLVYDKQLIEKYWKNQGSALRQRWTQFLGLSVPLLTKMITMVVSGGTEELSRNGASVAREAREIFEKLGPTYVKMGQMLSVRPDVLPQSALDELKILQDSVEPFDTATAIRQIESELGGPLESFFSEISEEPVAAASLAQVYKARLASTGEIVAVKVQRPAVLETVSKDLYVLRRAAEVYQGLVERFAPQQRTNYVGLLNEWAIGFYTELDFFNEGANQMRMRDLLAKENVTGVYIPEVKEELSTRRILVSEWVDGRKLSTIPKEDLKDLINPAQEAFATQLLSLGFFHADPHPGNILLLDEPRKVGDTETRMALIDFGLVASIKQEDIDTMVSSIIHLANRDYESLVDDFIALGVLPSDCNRALVVPLMDKALTPYVKGGGAKRYEEEVRKQYGIDGTMEGNTGGFQKMTQDALTVLNDIPFSIPPYFALLGRAIITLEGVALSGNPDYGLIMETYPFVARKLLREDRPEIQKALQEVLYSTSENGQLQTTRLSVLLNSALGKVATTGDAFVDLDSLPEDSVGISESLQFLLSPRAESLRKLLEEEAVLAFDILTRQAARKAYSQINVRIPRVPFFSNFLPPPETAALPFLIPKKTALNFGEAGESTGEAGGFSGGQGGEGALGGGVGLGGLSLGLSPRRIREAFTPVVLSPNQFLDLAAPKLSREEELYAISLTDLAKQTLGEDASVVVNGNALLDPRAASRFFLNVIGTGNLPSGLSSLVPAGAVERVAVPLLRLMSRTGGGTGGETGGVPSGSDDQGMRELSESLRKLDDVERRNLEEAGNRVVRRLVERVVDRLQEAI
uniref:Protein kinase domain-containing protein n=1 Tax=Chromera velia CCMP2878 TaxID=1169474 RepID=A0A0G4HXJ7_9ALVE|eukprot:Cvel_9276.t1-p1 / transcript=Cvel_9276.t1 / gene=Cvel_9276 / organism=Chromera_velia_CCMP2878 / gene_product=Uncharacterized aarF domain-containing protein, putative / transcript_product=Uncharacterized aarF domain-containing protein, putative / location=Cvel_scaffold530:40104-46186(-) / protein_length=881 / sequence_SO=supercontig / SO=protein_coding / is_pseudo=false